MSRTNFAACLGITLGYEGGYVDHPRDPGGATNMGITRATLAAYRGEPVTKQQVRDLTVEEAGRIYRLRYWGKVSGDNLPGGMDLIAFDGGVNSGPSRGAKWLQSGLRVTADGKIGAKTLTAAQNTPSGVAVIQRACAARMGFLRGLRTFTTFGRGWSRRVAHVEAEAVAMYSKSATTVAAQIGSAQKASKQKTAQAAGAAGGGSVTTFADIPTTALIAVIALAAVLALILVARGAHDRRRAAAYALKEQEMTT